METGSKRRLRVQQEREEDEERGNFLLIPVVGSNPPTAATATVDLDHRDWLDLPGLVLQFISNRLLNTPDLSSFAAVCRVSRSYAATSATDVPLVYRPPLLLRSFATPNQHKKFKNLPPHQRCKVQSIVPTNNLRLHNSKLPSTILRHRCLGISFGHIILNYGAETIIIADVFTGNQIRFVPNIAPPYYCKAILTAPMYSPSCLLMLVLFSCTAFCRPSNGELIFIKERRLFDENTIISIALVNGRAFCLSHMGMLGVFDLEPAISWQRFETFIVPDIDIYWPRSGFFLRNLVEWDGQLLLVVISDPDVHLRQRVTAKVYRLDLAQSAWIRIESLGNWSLFIDAVNTCSVSCRDPDKWGGRSNCVYVSGPGCESWSVIPVNGEEITKDTPLDEKFASLPKFPSPLWVYPSMLY